jgi:hypothetical protein
VKQGFTSVERGGSSVLADTSAYASCGKRLRCV